MADPAEIIARALFAHMFPSGGGDAIAQTRAWIDCLDAVPVIRAALTAAGLVIVPVEPTEAIQEGMADCLVAGVSINANFRRTIRDAYRAMIRASQEPTT